MNEQKVDAKRLEALDAEMNKLANNVLACRQLRGKQVIRDDEAQAFVDLLREWRAWKKDGDRSPRVFAHFVDRAKTFERRMIDRGYDKYRDVGISWSESGAKGKTPSEVIELAKKIPNAETARELFNVAERNLRNALEAASGLPGWPSKTQVAAHEMVLNVRRYLNQVAGSIPLSGPLSAHDAQRSALVALQSEKALKLITSLSGGVTADFLRDFQKAAAMILAGAIKAAVTTAKEIVSQTAAALKPEIPVWVPAAGLAVGLGYLAWKSKRETSY